MATPLRHWLRSAAKQGCATSDEDSGHHHSEVLSAQLGGSEPPSLVRPSPTTNQCDGSTISLTGMFDGEEEERLELMTSDVRVEKQQEERTSVDDAGKTEEISMSASMEEMLAMGTRLLK